MRTRCRRARTTRPGIATAAGLAVALIGAACGNVYEQSDASRSGSAASPAANTGNPTGAVDKTKLAQKNPSREPGVTDTTIRVGGVTAKTNILSLPVDQAFNGVQAYFDMINSEGGIYGRRLELTSRRDDQMIKNKEEAQGLVSQDNVFAVAPVATVIFTGSQVLADSSIPTFGWNIQTEWAGPPNLFGEKGSYICVTCAYPTQAYVARQIGAKKIGVLAYGVDQSAQCVKGVKAGFDKWPTAQIVFTDDAIPFGNPDYGVQVQKMREAGVQMIITCMDTGGVINIAREVAKQSANIAQYIQMGYDYDLVGTYAKEFEGSIVVNQFVPIEFAQQPAGIVNYLKWIDKVPGAKRGELSLAGWLDADLLYRGIALAGPDFTRQKVIDAINALSNWTADSITAGVDWTSAHTRELPVSCQTFVKVQGGRFVPQWTEPGKAFVCIDNNVATIPDTPRHKAGGDP